MLKKLSLLLICLLLTACSSQTSSNQNKNEVEPLLVDHTWEVSVMGYSGEVKFNENGTGTAKYQDQDIDFSYKLSDFNDDKTQAKITITSAPIKELVGKSADIKVSGSKLKLSYEGFTVNLNSTDDNS